MTYSISQPLMTLCDGIIYNSTTRTDISASANVPSIPVSFHF